MGRLEGKIAVVTGGASGIGLAVSERFARDGAQLVLVDRRADRFDEAVARVGGGARGVDQVAMLSALNAGGSVIGVLADGLFKAAVAGKYREGIREKRMVLISPFHPEARFMVGNAMGRNKLVYALTDFALVVSAEKDKGGTWAGAREELNRPEPKPVFVRMGGETPRGNLALMKLGARPFPVTPWEDNLGKLIEDAAFAQAETSPSQGSLFGAKAEPVAIA